MLDFAIGAAMLAAPPPVTQAEALRSMRPTRSDAGRAVPPVDCAARIVAGVPRSRVAQEDTENADRAEQQGGQIPEDREVVGRPRDGDADVVIAAEAERSARRSPLRPALGGLAYLLTGSGFLIAMTARKSRWLALALVMVISGTGLLMYAIYT